MLIFYVYNAIKLNDRLFLHHREIHSACVSQIRPKWFYLQYCCSTTWGHCYRCNNI